MLSTIESPPSIPASVLKSSAGLCLGDIHFAELCTTLRMRVVSIMLLETLIANGSFNPECKAETDYSHSTAILLVLVPNTKLKDIEKVGIGLVVCQHGGPPAGISPMQKFISYIHDVLQQERASHKPIVRTCVMLLGNYSGHMAFSTDPPFCLAYLAEYLEKKDLGAMMIWSLDNHPVTFMVLDMVVHQLLALDCLECDYARMSHGGHLIIPRGTQFRSKLYPEIVIPRNHGALYPDPTTGQEAPSMTEGPFCGSDLLFPGVARDWQLYTAQEVMHLRNAGVLNPFATPGFAISATSSSAFVAQMQSAPITQGVPKMDLCSPKVELDSSSKRREVLSSSKSHRHQPSVAIRSSTSLERSTE